MPFLSVAFKPSPLTLRLTFYSIGELGLGSVANCARCWCSVIHALATDAVANGPTVVGWYSGLTTSTENTLSSGMTQ